MRPPISAQQTYKLRVGMEVPSLSRTFFLFLALAAPLVLATYRYYGGYLPYGTGDTIIQTWHNHGGSLLGERKWIVECMDGEGLIGIQDWNDDFEKLQSVWCKFLFPYKPASQGLYPYYPSCYMLNYLNQWFCYNAQNSSQTIDTFIVGLWDNEYNWYTYRVGGFGTINGDDLQPYKCCKVPKGYYIDYVSCYYEPTHDNFFEYYDSTFHYMVYCGTGYVMTGIAKKPNPYDKENHIEWIQCCRVGFGVQRVGVPPPIVKVGNGRPAYTAQYNVQPATVPPSYQAQYRTTQSKIPEIGQNNEITYNLSSYQQSNNDLESMRYKTGPMPNGLRSKRAAGVATLMGNERDTSDFSFVRSSM